MRINKHLTPYSGYPKIVSYSSNPFTPRIAMSTFLSPKTLAQAIGVSESSLKRWADEGLLDVVRTAGAHRRIDLREAIRYIRAAGHPILRPDLLGVPGLDGSAPASSEDPHDVDRALV